MNAARGDYSRRIDWSGVKPNPLIAMSTQIVRFVRGIRGPRQDGVTRKQILAWFSGTPEEFVQKGVTEAVLDGKIRCCRRSLGSNRRSNGAHDYVVDDDPQAFDKEDAEAQCSHIETFLMSAQESIRRGDRETLRASADNMINVVAALLEIAEKGKRG